MERAMAMGKCLEIQERYSRCSTLIQDRVWQMLIVLFFQIMIQEDGNLEISYLNVRCIALPGRT